MNLKRVGYYTTETQEVETLEPRNRQTAFLTPGTAPVELTRSTRQDYLNLLTPAGKEVSLVALKDNVIKVEVSMQQIRITHGRR